MIAGDSIANCTARTAEQFTTTHWSVVVAAGDSAAPGAQEALEKLCQTYWYPVYVYIRRKGHAKEDAEDLAQAFFERFLRKHCVKDAVPERGRFRSFLLTILQRFLCDEFDYAHTGKRGGAARFVRLDAVEAAGGLEPAVAPSQSPESLFDRAWADTVVQTSLDRLSEEFEAEGRGSHFTELKEYLSCPADRAAYTASGQRLGLSADAVAMAVVRLRKRYREIVRSEVTNTVASPAEIDDEMRYLVGLLTR